MRSDNKILSVSIVFAITLFFITYIVAELSGAFCIIITIITYLLIHSILTEIYENKDISINDLLKYASQTIYELNQLTEEIRDNEVKWKVYKLIDISQGILHFINMHPEYIDDGRLFIMHHLKQTLKLLKDYIEIQENAKNNKHVIKTMETIKNSLDSLISSFENQNNRILKPHLKNIDDSVEILMNYIQIERPIDELKDE